MSVRALSWALREAKVAAKSDLLVLIVLADHAHDDGGGAYPSVETIAKLARLTRRGAQKSLRRLEDAGLIAARRRPGLTTVYSLSTGEHSSGANTVRSELEDAGGRTEVHKAANTVRPNRKEPSRTVRGTAPDFSRYDEGVIE